jgi:hypothetical protein
MLSNKHGEYFWDRPAIGKAASKERASNALTDPVPSLPVVEIYLLFAQGARKSNFIHGVADSV